MCFQGGFGDFFTFYELESSSRRSIRSGMREARKRNCEGKHCCCCSHPPKTFFAGGGKPLAKSSNAISDSHPSWERRKSPMQKKGGKGFIPHRPLTILPASSSPHLPNNERSLVPGASSSSSLVYTRLCKIYNYMQREGPAGRAGFESMSY